MSAFERFLTVIGNRKVTRSLFLTVLFTALGFGVAIIVAQGGAGIEAKYLVALFLLLIGIVMVTGYLRGSYINPIATIIEVVKETDERDDAAVTQPEPTPDASAVKAVGAESAKGPR